LPPQDQKNYPHFKAMHYIQIKKAQLVPDAHGKHIQITMIGLWQTSETPGLPDVFVKWIKLTPEIVEGLLSKRFTVSGDKLDRMMK